VFDPGEAVSKAEEATGLTVFALLILNVLVLD
jgi:hypothetical protein